MRVTRVILVATALILATVGAVSLVMYRAAEEDVVSAFSEQQLTVARTVAVALDADANALEASLRQLNSLPSIQALDVDYIGQRVQAAFEPAATSVVLQVVRISADKQLYTWSVGGQRVESPVAGTADDAAWDWFRDRQHVGQMRIGPVWWDPRAPSYHRMLSMPVWRVARSGPIPVPTNDFSGVLGFVIDARRLLQNYAQPTSLQSMRGSMSLELDDSGSKFVRVGTLSPAGQATDRVHRESQGSAVVDGYVWAWAHLGFANEKWRITIATPYDVASAHVRDWGRRQLTIVGALLVLVPAGAWVLVQRERRAEEERRLWHIQLAQAQKMDAIGKLAGGIAHDFNNLLTAILGNASLILEDVEAGSPVHQEATQVRRAAESAATLTQKLLAFGRRQVLHTEQFDLRQLLDDVMQLVRRVVGEHIDLRSDFQQDLWRVVADPVQVEQAVINLAVNARDAMPDGGTLEIVARNVSRPKGERRPDCQIEPGEYVQITVRDTGIGMDESIRARMFEPFFTTKPKGKGTGLGLSSVYGIVRQSGGYIHVTSAPDAGTTMELLLPRAANVDAGTTQRTESEEPAPGSETILLVEDDEPVRDLARASLERQGYSVLTARDPDDALRIAHQHPNGIALLLTDVRMPGMQGPELATRLRFMRPGLRVLFMSGYAAEAVTSDTLKRATLLEKPFLPGALTRAVRRALDRRS
jgi:signal transduction histidine kinase/ActR/RegA family two-component response regulator